MALRSFDKFLRFGVNVVIIGDREEWMSDVVTVIEHECVSDNPQIDVLEKLKLAIAADEVTDKFIWSNDDIYLVAPVMLAHIEVPKIKESCVQNYIKAFIGIIWSVQLHCWQIFPN